MTILSDGEIRRLFPRPFDPWVNSALQPASYEVVLADRMITSKGLEVPQDEAGGWWLKPGDFWLGSTFETLTIPTHLVAQVNGKSTLGRQGLLVHATAGFIDPGFTGQITLELKNVGDKSLRLTPGQAIAQIVLMTLGKPAEVPYGSARLGSHYQNQKGPTQAHTVKQDSEEAPTAHVVLFRRDGKYYTEERWRIPEGATGPWDMEGSPDFCQIMGGPVLVVSQEPWGYPFLLGLRPKAIETLVTATRNLRHVVEEAWPDSDARLQAQALLFRALEALEDGEVKK